MKSELPTLFDMYYQMSLSDGYIEYIYGNKIIKKSHKEVLEDVQRAVSFLKNQLSIAKNDYIGIKAENCYEWIVLDLAIQYIGAIIVPIDINNSISLLTIKEKYALKYIFTTTKENEKLAFEISIHIDFSLYDKTNLVPVIYKDDDVLCLKFSSGTTSAPKAMEVIYSGVNHHIINIQQMFNHSKDDRIMLFLPLSLIQQRYFVYSSFLYEYTLILTNTFLSQYSVKFQNPTVILGVPYFYENIYKTFMQKLEKDTRLKLQFDTFLKSNEKQFLPFINDLGGKIKYLWTGSAPISIEILSFFERMGVSIYQGYGSSETGIVSKCYPNTNKIGSVGKLLKDKEIRFEEDGELLVKSKFPVVKNYLDIKDESIFRKDGFICTGDIGYLDDEGYLFIIGRKKTMIALSSGKKIFPNLIENEFKNGIDEIEHCVVFGDNKPFLVALFFYSKNGDVDILKEKIFKINNSLSKDEKIINYAIYPSDEIKELISNQGKIQTSKIKENYNIEKMYDI